MIEILSSFKEETKRNSFIARIGAISISRIKMTLNYKSSYLMVLVLNITIVFMYFFFGKLNPDMEIFGLNATYFEYCIIGLCLQMIVGTSLGTANGNINNEIASGTWSSLFLQFNFLEYSIGTTTAGVFLSSFSILIVLSIAFLIGNFAFSITFQEVLLILLIFILILASHMVISMLFTSFTIFYQKDSGLVSLIYQLTKTFSGILFPIALLSGFPLFISNSLPFTYGLETLHMILFSDSIQWKLLAYNCSILLGMITVIGIIAYVLVFLSLKNVKKNGKVDWY